MKPSAVGKRYNELIVMKVVITVVLTLLVNQQLEPGELDLSIEFGLRMLTLGYNTSSFTGMVSDYEVRTLNMTFQELMVLNVEAATEYPAQKVQGGCYFDTTQAGGIHPVQGLYCCPERRATEIKQYIYNQTSMAAFDVKLVTRSGGLHNIVNTIFLALLLTTMFFLFSRDVTKLVVRPIESMIDIVRKLAENPSLTLAGQSKSKYETESVRVALAKIVGLMQLGFGGAGHEIIAANLANAEGQDLDLMVRGRSSTARTASVTSGSSQTPSSAFRTRRERARPPPAPPPPLLLPASPCFPLCIPTPRASPSLTPRSPFRSVMLFTNPVGTIVHQACHDNRGEPNKNIGDAFLIVWRPKAGLQHTKIVDGALTGCAPPARPPPPSAPPLPLAPALFPRPISPPPPLLPRRSLPPLRARDRLVEHAAARHQRRGGAQFGYGKYRTKLGFGLHFGWSVEGPVGTPMKIDCSYLSPEVKISDRLEAATKIYSSNILMSGQFYDLLSDHMKVGIRLVDHITLKGGHKPFRMHARATARTSGSRSTRASSRSTAPPPRTSSSPRPSTRASTRSSRATGRRRGRSSRAPPSSARRTRRRTADEGDARAQHRPRTPPLRSTGRAITTRRSEQSPPHCGGRPACTVTSLVVAPLLKEVERHSRASLDSARSAQPAPAACGTSAAAGIGPVAPKTADAIAPKSSVRGLFAGGSSGSRASRRACSGSAVFSKRATTPTSTAATSRKRATASAASSAVAKLPR